MYNYEIDNNNRLVIPIPKTWVIIHIFCDRDGYRWLYDEEINERRQWINEIATDSWTYYRYSSDSESPPGTAFAFKSNDDALAFKLRWL